MLRQAADPAPRAAIGTACWRLWILEIGRTTPCFILRVLGGEILVNMCLLWLVEEASKIHWSTGGMLVLVNEAGVRMHRINMSQREPRTFEKCGPLSYPWLKSPSLKLRPSCSIDACLKAEIEAATPSPACLELPSPTDMVDTHSPALFDT